jgi:glycosyltransferase involved in cell wall biosynthesis
MSDGKTKTKPMRILVATDAWYPQVNGVVRTLTHIAQEVPALGARIELLTPDGYWTVPLPGYPEISLALPRRTTIARRIAALAPDAVHIATEGPLGFAVRAYCRRNGVPFSTSFHTRFPDYAAVRLPLPARWTGAAVWAALRAFHAPASAVMVPTPSLAVELTAHGFGEVTLWPRGVDADLFRPRERSTRFHRPVFLTVGRLAAEKNLEAFLALDLPGTKVLVGDGPHRAMLMRRFPDAVFLGPLKGRALARAYADADVFVFPSRTDTFGLVMLEALASGVPVAAFPVDAPRDVIGQSAVPVGVLDEDLRAACLRALTSSRDACRAFALGMSWQASARAFLAHVAPVSGTVLRGAVAREAPAAMPPAAQTGFHPA